jgi:hypothetical protein
MAIPVVTQPSTPRTIAQGVAIPTLSISATGSPTSYAATPLPAGITVDTTTGAITGTPTESGLTTTVITATNGDGTSASVNLVWNVQGSAVGDGVWSDLPLDFNLITREVTIPGVTTVEGEPLFRVGRGDAFSLLVGATKYGVLQDLKPASEVVTVECALKEREPESVITLTGGSTTKVGSADTTRFRAAAEFLNSEWTNVLGNYEEDEKTSHLAPTEISITVDLLRFTSLPFLVEVIRDQVPD